MHGVVPGARFNGVIPGCGVDQIVIRAICRVRTSLLISFAALRRTLILHIPYARSVSDDGLRILVAGVYDCLGKMAEMGHDRGKTLTIVTIRLINAR